MEHKGNKWMGRTSQFKKRRRDCRKDKEMIFDNSVIAEESDYVIMDEEGNVIHPDNRMARIFHPNYKHHL